jgi:hypothetical protein
LNIVEAKFGHTSKVIERASHNGLNVVKKYYSQLGRLVSLVVHTGLVRTTFDRLSRGHPVEANLCRLF